MISRNPATHASFFRRISSSLSEIDALFQELRLYLSEHGLSSRQFVLEITAREFLNNAIIHGNQFDDQKHVTFSLVLGRKWISLQIEDEGPGFNWRKAKQKQFPHETESSGRGLVIGCLYAKRVRFNRCGNIVTLWMKKE